MRYSKNLIDLALLNMNAPHDHKAQSLVSTGETTVTAVACACGRTHPLSRGIKVNWKKRFLSSHELATLAHPEYLGTL